MEEENTFNFVQRSLLNVITYVINLLLKKL